MLGFNVADAIAFGSLCAAFLAALAGMLGSDRSGRTAGSPSEHRPGSAASRQESIAALTAAIAELAAAIRAAASADLAHDQHTDMIHALMRRLDDHDRNND